MTYSGKSMTYPGKSCCGRKGAAKARYSYYEGIQIQSLKHAVPIMKAYDSNQRARISNYEVHYSYYIYTRARAKRALQRGEVILQRGEAA